MRAGIIELCRADQRIHDGHAIGAALGANEESRLSVKSLTTQRPVGGIVDQADPPVCKEVRKPFPASMAWATARDARV